MKRINHVRILRFTNAELTGAEVDRVFKRRDMVVNDDTGEVRYGPGTWRECLRTGGTTVVRAATTANITIATGLNAGATVDGVVLADGDLVLVGSNNTASQNGVYVAGATPVRATGFDTWNEHVGALIMVKEGTQNKGKLFRCLEQAGGTLGSSQIRFGASHFGPLDFSGRQQVANLPDETSLSNGHVFIVEDPTTGQLRRVSAAAVKTWVTA